MSIETGGPAFPVPQELDYDTGRPKDRYRYDEQGMTLRDWFAGHALAGMIAGRFQPPPMPDMEVDEAVAECAYIYADAMLKQRTKEPSDA